MLLLIELLKVFFSSLEYSAMIIFSLSLFRIPFRYKLGTIYGISFFLSAVSFYFRDFANMIDFEVLTVLITEIILIMLTFSLPFFYSLLLCTIGFLAGATVELTSVIVGALLHITSQELVANSLPHLIGIQLSTALLLSIFIYLLQRKKLGFMFIIKRLSARDALKGYNFLLSAILLISIVIIQIELLYFKQFSVHIYFPIVMTVILLIGIWVAHRHNMKQIRDKYLIKG